MISSRIPGLNLAAWDDIPDEEVVKRVRAGETALYEILMRRYNQRLYRVARSILRDDAEAEDVMQEAYVRAYEHLNQFAGEAKFSTWLTKIAVYEALGRVRRRGRTEDLDSGLDAEHVTAKTKSDTPDPERQAYDHELRLVLERAIDALPEIYRVVFTLRTVEGLPWPRPLRVWISRRKLSRPDFTGGGHCCGKISNSVRVLSPPKRFRFTCRGAIASWKRSFEESLLECESLRLREGGSSQFSLSGRSPTVCAGAPVSWTESSCMYLDSDGTLRMHWPNGQKPECASSSKAHPEASCHFQSNTATGCDQPSFKTTQRIPNSGARFS